ncbi:MAG: hypothetical protein ACP5U2_16060 [Bryobacteraceae bacterium]
MNQEPITKAELARRLRLSRGRISQLVCAGLPVRPDGRVNFREAEQWYQQNVSPEQGGWGQGPRGFLSGAKPAGARDEYATARLVELAFRARLRRLEFETRAAKLVETAVANERWQRIRAALQAEIAAVPGRLAPAIVPLTDERQIRDLLQREVYALLERLRLAVIAAR